MADGQVRKSLNPGAVPFNPPGAAQTPTALPALPQAIVRLHQQVPGGFNITTDYESLPNAMSYPPGLVPTDIGSWTLAAAQSAAVGAHLSGLHAPAGAKPPPLAPVQAPKQAATAEAVPKESANQLKSPVAQLAERIIHERQASYSKVWNQAERDMAKRNPEGWLALATSEYNVLVDTYGPGKIPEQVLEAHKSKFADAYAYKARKQCAASKATLQPPLPDPALPVHLQNLTNAVNDFHITEASSRFVPQFGVKAAPLTATPSSPYGISTVPEQLPMPAPERRHPQAQVLVDSEPKSFSPGPAFPALGANPVPRRATTPTMVQATGNRQSEERQRNEELLQQTPTRQGPFQIPYPGGPIAYTPSKAPQHVTPRPSRRQGPNKRYHPLAFEQQPEAIPLNAFIKGTTRGTRRPSKRRVRTDQGPLPSAADIYPDDMDVQSPQDEMQSPEGIMGLSSLDGGPPQNFSSPFAGPSREFSNSFTAAPQEYRSPFVSE